MDVFSLLLGFVVGCLFSLFMFKLIVGDVVCSICERNLSKPYLIDEVRNIDEDA